MNQLPTSAIPGSPDRDDVPGELDIQATVANLTMAVEQMDAGMKMALDLLVQYDQRIRFLELAQRKADRRNVPVIVNSSGSPVRSN